MVTADHAADGGDVGSGTGVPPGIRRIHVRTARITVRRSSGRCRVTPGRSSSSSSGTATRRLVSSACRASLTRERLRQPGEHLRPRARGARAAGRSRPRAGAARPARTAAAAPGRPGPSSASRYASGRGERPAGQVAPNACSTARRATSAARPAGPRDDAAAAHGAAAAATSASTSARSGRSEPLPQRLDRRARLQRMRPRRAGRPRRRAARAAAAQCSGSASQSPGHRRHRGAGTPIRARSARRDQQPAAQLAGRVRCAVHGRPARAARAAAAPRRRSARRGDVEHGHAAGHVVPARVAQQRPVADAQRQRPARRSRAVSAPSGRTRTGTAAEPRCRVSVGGQVGDRVAVHAGRRPDR